MRTNSPIKILSIEAKDLYGAMNPENGKEPNYSIRDINGNLSIRKFTNSLSLSLDIIKLQEVYRKELRRKDMTFVVNNRKYTQTLINVKFTYSYKEFNNAGVNTYVRAGYNFRDCEMTDGVCIKNGKLIAIQTNVEVKNPVSPELLGKTFGFYEGHYKVIKSIPVLMSKSEIRQYLYEHGFVCDGIKYVRYKRSSGSSRVGKCLFVDSRLAERMSKWDKCGLDIKEGDPIDLAAWEAYISLPMSNIIDTINISPEEILIINDYKSIFEDEVVAVEVEKGRLVASQKKQKISNSIWDGESLLDVSLFDKYSNRGMLLLRNRFFKTCAFNTNIQEFFRDNDITHIEQLNGFTLATDISQIKLITTPSSVKYCKFGSVFQWLSNIDTTFGIVKYEKEPHFFEGRMVQSHYQLFNTLQLDYEAVATILAPSLNYVSAIRNDPDILRYHIKYVFQDDDEQYTQIKSKNDIIYKMLGINNKFANTKLYREFRNDTVKGFLRSLKQGHVLLNGNYSVLLGNGLEMLKASIGIFDGAGELQRGEIHSLRFPFGREVLGSRSPHITMGNILLAKNVAHSEIDRYFNLSKEIVYVNAINDNIQQRLNGADYDSDTMLLTDNELLIKAAKVNYGKFKVPTCFVESQKTERKYTNDHKADLDIRTSVNKIGEIVNLSQQLNSIFWEKVNKGTKIEDCLPLYYDICKLSVLSGIEIDKAKKEFIINSANEIGYLKTKYKIFDNSKQVKPMFFKMITVENGYKVCENTKHRYFETAMDYLQKVVSQFSFRHGRARKLPEISFMDVIKKPDSTVRTGYNCKQRDKIVQIVRKAKDEIRLLYIDYDMKTKEERLAVRQLAMERKQQCIDDIEKLSNGEYTMYITLKELETKEYRDVSRFMFEVLFGKPNETFFTLIQKSKEPLYQLTETDDGDIDIYGLKFSKTPSNSNNAA